MSAAERTLLESKITVGRSTTSVPALVERRSLRTQRADHAPSRIPWKAIGGVALVALVGLAAVAGVEGWQSEPTAAAGTRPHGESPVHGVTIVRPAPATNSSVALPATFRPWQSATLNARVSGYLTAWHRDLGATVKAGELLAEIQTPELDQEVAEAEALAREADAAAVQARAERTEAEADLRVAEAQLLRVQAELELAKSQLARRQQLLANRATSQEEVDTYQRQVEAGTASLTAAGADISRRRTNLQTRSAVIAAREAAAKSRQSNVERLKELQSFQRITAPFDGVITSRTAEVGMLVTAGKDTLFIVEDLSKIRVQLHVPQTYAMQIAPGVLASISLPESQLPPVPGEIARIAESVNVNSRTMLAEIELDNAAHRYQPGSYAQVTLAAPQNGASWTVPTNTITMRTNGPHVALVNDQDQIEIKHVTLGRDLGNRVVVAEGIRGGERLVVNPGDELKSGLRVEIDRQAEAAPKVAER